MASHQVVVACVLLAWGAGMVAGGEAPVVRKEHPRIWLTPQRLEAMQAKVKANDSAYLAVKAKANGGDVLCSALMYVLSKDPAYAKKPIEHLKTWKLSDVALTPQSTASDAYRWSGHLSILVYDWCYDQLGAEERAEFIKQYNRYVEVMNQKQWGGLRMPENNYYGGILRNSGLFGIATAYENDRAKGFMDHARVDRWEKVSLPYFRAGGKGGVFGEGPGYSTANAQYYIQYIDAVETATGEELLRQTPFFLEFVYYAICATTPQPTVPTPPTGEAKAYYQAFAYGDLENRPGGCPAWSYYSADIFHKTAQSYAGTPVGEQAQHWLNQVQAGVPKDGEVFALIFGDARRKERDFSELPPDYYVTGLKQLYSRSDWSQDATALSVQCNPAMNHGHIDAGTFQICRKGRWLTKEATGYSVAFKDCGCNDMAAHNGLLFGDKGPVEMVYAGYGPAEVVALESRPDYAYLACDLSRYYNWSKPEEYRKRDAYAKPSRDAKIERVVREFVYLRPDTLVVLDRLVSGGAERKKTFMVHFVEEPTIKDNEHLVLGTSGGQALSCHTLLPVKPGYRVVSLREGVARMVNDATYTWRLEVSSAEKDEELFLHVLRAGDKSAAEPEFRLVQGEGKLGVGFQEGGKTYRVQFQDQVSALGGEVSIADGGKDLLRRKLAGKVQGIDVDETGVRWERLP